ncbi:hypothetical protein [Candidatus Halobonum tyrrellensis]|uniref:Major facilitator superfamily protein n=1 Tax=Candidatus Halobonum tyrrellensis G22 TaxID=1324957 RepID=V4HAL7_9EURY|nr:hypothetical protein [Candidatus Halobonum tyrrellensis]ESP87098.1 major facilitator superfamily protein [Candidatus Halobonum tyrrellensis G22]
MGVLDTDRRSIALGVAIGPLSASYLAGIDLSVGQPYATPFVFGAVLALVGFVLVYTQVEEPGSTAAGSPAADPSSGD